MRLCLEVGLLEGKRLTVDGTLVTANASPQWDQARAIGRSGEGLTHGAKGRRKNLSLFLILLKLLGSKARAAFQTVSAHRLGRKGECKGKTGTERRPTFWTLK